MRKTNSFRVKRVFACLLVLGCVLGLSLNGLAYTPVTLKNHLAKPGKFPGQYELKEFEKITGVHLKFKENPRIKELYAKVPGHPHDLPSVDKRLPEEPLVVVPVEEVGKYGGILRGVSHATEAGTSDLLSIRHVNLVRLDPNKKTIKPFVAKGWKWNKDYTEITFYLRKGHKWSDGKPFTAYDIEFWYNDLILNKKVYPKTPTIWTVAGQPLKVKAINDTTVKFILPKPKPNFLLYLATTYAQPFQPKHYLSRFLPKYNPKADAEAKKLGYKDWYDRLSKYYRSSDWKDVPTPLLNGAGHTIVPTLESYLVVEDTAKGRKLVPNPYFFCVDTAGNQLPYIDGIQESYVPDKEVRNLMITNGQVDYKAQALFLTDYPLYKENEKKGHYRVVLALSPGDLVFYAFNTTHKDPKKRKLFNNVKFREAMSLAMNRKEVNELIYLGQGKPTQIAGVNCDVVDFAKKWANYKIAYDPAKAKKILDSLGLKDVNGDGFRELPDGSKLTIYLTYSNQGAPVKMHQLVKSYWEAVGIKTVLKEVTSDEYRALANKNELDLTTWKNDKGSPVAVASAPAVCLLPIFGDYFNPGTGFEWATYLQTNGQQGIKPPQDVFTLQKLVKKFASYPMGSKEYDQIGAQIAAIHARNLWKIGMVGKVPVPVIFSARLRNVPPVTISDYSYYWAYSLNPIQWYFK